MADQDGLRGRGAVAEGKRKGAESAPYGNKLSVVVPTYNEVETIRPLCERLFKALKQADLEAELVFVDDESVGSEATANIVKDLAKEGHPVRIHCRKKTEGRGLSSAVLIGFDSAKYPVLLCMDADLQHEPESVPDIARPVLSGRAEFALGSRHVAGGGLGFDWSIFRQIVSMGATLLAWPLAKSTDPMSGFFCTRKDVLDRRRNAINPIGFKIGLEVMVRCRCQLVEDVAITFRERAAGESKLSASQYKLYVLQLMSLYWDVYPLLVILFIWFALAALVLVVLWGPVYGAKLLR